MHRLNLWLRGHQWVGDAALVLLMLLSWSLQTGHGWGPLWEQALVLGGLVLPLLSRCTSSDSSPPTGGCVMLTC